MYADMICDVMPPIPEDAGGNGSNLEGTGSDNGEEAEANIEQLMVSMLEERDKVRWSQSIFLPFNISSHLVTRKITWNRRYFKYIPTETNWSRKRTRCSIPAIITQCSTGLFWKKDFLELNSCLTRILIDVSCVQINQHKILTTARETVSIRWQIDISFSIVASRLFWIDGRQGYFGHLHRIKSNEIHSIRFESIISYSFESSQLSCSNTDALDDKKIDHRTNERNISFIASYSSYRFAPTPDLIKKIVIQDKGHVVFD